MYDLVLRSGTLIDPGQRLHAAGDLAIVAGKIAAHLAPGAPAPARQTVDCRGCLVVPGLIDLHVHAFEGVIHFGIDIDRYCLARGVTTALDLGSCGGLMIDGFRRHVLDVAQTRLLTLAHISAKGMLGSLHAMPWIGDLDDLRYCDAGVCVAAIERHRDRVLGVKVRLTDVLADGGKNELPALLLAREAADRSRTPLVVHMPDSTLPLSRILQEMRPGDMLTHVFHGRRCGTLDANGKVEPLLRELVDAGLWLDVGHGVGSFSFDVARRGLQQGLLPHFISSDLHRYNTDGPVFDLVTTMAKFLHLGMRLDDCIERVTTLPARFLRREGELGTLAVDSIADIAVLERQEGEFPLTDTLGVTEMGHVMLEPRIVVKGGELRGVLPKQATGAV